MSAIFKVEDIFLIKDQVVVVGELESGVLKIGSRSTINNKKAEVTEIKGLFRSFDSIEANPGKPVRVAISLKGIGKEDINVLDLIYFD